MLYPTPQQLAMLYEVLRSFSPFREWDLPPASAVRFRTEPKSWMEHGRRHKGRAIQGLFYTRRGGEPVIYCSPHRGFQDLTRTLAHEMVHLYEHLNGDMAEYRGDKYIHGKQFRALAEEVCKAMGFAREGF